MWFNYFISINSPGQHYWHTLIIKCRFYKISISTIWEMNANQPKRLLNKDFQRNTEILQAQNVPRAQFLELVLLKKIERHKMFICLLEWGWLKKTPLCSPSVISVSYPVASHLVFHHRTNTRKQWILTEDWVCLFAAVYDMVFWTLHIRSLWLVGVHTLDFGQMAHWLHIEHKSGTTQVEVGK